VEEFTFALGQQKDKLKELWDTTSNSVLHSRDAELIKKTNEDIRSLNQAVHATVPHCLLVEKKLYSSSKIEFQHINSSLIYWVYT